MTIKEMVYVLDKSKECVLIRSHNQCKKDCNHCSCTMEPTIMTDALDRITDLLVDFGRHSTKKDF